MYKVWHTVQSSEQPHAVILRRKLTNNKRHGHGCRERHICTENTEVLSRTQDTRTLSEAHGTSPVENMRHPASVKLPSSIMKTNEHSIAMQSCNQPQERGQSKYHYFGNTVHPSHHIHSQEKFHSTSESVTKDRDMINCPYRKQLY